MENKPAWKDLACSLPNLGIAQAADGTWYVVGNYRPPGNIVDQFATNVLPP